jgi:hypothetical protein
MHVSVSCFRPIFFLLCEIECITRQVCHLRKAKQVLRAVTGNRRAWHRARGGLGPSRQAPVLAPGSRAERRGAPAAYRRINVGHPVFSPELFCPPISLFGRATATACQFLRQRPLGANSSAAPPSQPSFSTQPYTEATLPLKLKSTPGSSVLADLARGRRVASPPTTAVSLNSGATSAPPRAERPARQQSDGQRRAGERERARDKGAGGARTTPRNIPTEESRRARSRAFAPVNGHASFSPVQ